MKTRDWRGHQIGMLKVVGKDPVRIRNAQGLSIVFWMCRCRCGVKKLIRAGDLQQGKVKSCGCARAQMIGASKIKHGLSKRGKINRTYYVWQAMKRRCYDSTVRCFKNYGGRGIAYDERWEEFGQFLDDMGEAPPGMQLDRIDNDGMYCKSNCRWATTKQQSLNRRTTVLIKHQGKLLHINEVAALTGLSERTIRARRRYGWTDHEICSRPLHSRTGSVQ